MPTLDELGTALSAVTEGPQAALENAHVVEQWLHDLATGQGGSESVAATSRLQESLETLGDLASLMRTAGHERRSYNLSTAAVAFARRTSPDALRPDQERQRIDLWLSAAWCCLDPTRRSDLCEEILPAIVGPILEAGESLDASPGREPETVRWWLLYVRWLNISAQAIEHADPVTATGKYQRAAGIAMALHRPASAALMWSNLGYMRMQRALSQRDAELGDQAIEAFQRSLQYCDEVGDPRAVATTLIRSHVLLGDLLRGRVTRVREAREHYRAVVEQLRSLYSETDETGLRYNHTTLDLCCRALRKITAGDFFVMRSHEDLERVILDIQGFNAAERIPRLVRDHVRIIEDYLCVLVFDGRQAEADELLDSLGVLAPREHQVLGRLRIRLHEARGELVEALSLLGPYTDARQLDERALLYRAALLVRVGELDEAGAQARRILRYVDPTSRPAHLILFVATAVDPEHLRWSSLRELIDSCPEGESAALAELCFALDRDRDALKLLWTWFAIPGLPPTDDALPADDAMLDQVIHAVLSHLEFHAEHQEDLEVWTVYLLGVLLQHPVELVQEVLGEGAVDREVVERSLALNQRHIGVALPSQRLSREDTEERVRFVADPRGRRQDLLQLGLEELRLMTWSWFDDPDPRASAPEPSDPLEALVLEEELQRLQDYRIREAGLRRTLARRHEELVAAAPRVDLAVSLAREAGPPHAGEADLAELSRRQLAAWSIDHALEAPVAAAAGDLTEAEQRLVRLGSSLRPELGHGVRLVLALGRSKSRALGPLLAFRSRVLLANLVHRLVLEEARPFALDDLVGLQAWCASMGAVGEVYYRACLSDEVPAAGMETLGGVWAHLASLTPRWSEDFKRHLRTSQESADNHDVVLTLRRIAEDLGDPALEEALIAAASVAHSLTPPLPFEPLAGLQAVLEEATVDLDLLEGGTHPGRSLVRLDPGDRDGLQRREENRQRLRALVERRDVLLGGDRLLQRRVWEALHRGAALGSGPALDLLADRTLALVLAELDSSKDWARADRRWSTTLWGSMLDGPLPTMLRVAVSAAAGRRERPARNGVGPEA